MLSENVNALVFFFLGGWGWGWLSPKDILLIQYHFCRTEVKWV